MTVMTCPERTWAGRELAHRVPQHATVSAEARKTRVLSQIATRMIAPVTIWVKNGEMCIRIRPLPITAMVSAPRRRAEDRAAAAHQRGAAEHDGGDHLQLEADGGVRRARAEAGGDDEAGERRGDAGEDIDRGDDPSRRHADPARGLGVRADGHDLAAVLGRLRVTAAERDHERPRSGRHRNAEEPAAAELHEQPSDADRDRIALGQPERDAAQDREASEGDDEGRDPLVGDEPALQRADRGAEASIAMTTAARAGPPRARWRRRR